MTTCSPAQADVLARHASTPATAVLLEPGHELVPLLDGRAVGGYRPVRGWALTPGDVAAPPELRELALSRYLDVLRQRGMRPVFLAVADPRPYARRGLFVSPSVDEAVIDPRRPACPAPAHVGLTVASCRDHHTGQVAALPVMWSGNGDAGVAGRVRVAVDATGAVLAAAGWYPYADGARRRLGWLRRDPRAPSPAVDLLLAAAVRECRDQGVAELSLGSVPVAAPRFTRRADRYRALRGALDRVRPEWRTRWLALLSGWQAPAAVHRLSRAGLPVPPWWTLATRCGLRST